MPELPDIVNYVNALQDLLEGANLIQILVRSPFVLRTYSPPIEDAAARRITGFSRRGKRIVWHLEGDRYLVFHLMIAGRFHWHPSLKRPVGKQDLLAIQTDRGTMMLTEVSSQKRAGLWIFSSVSEVDQTDPGGLDILRCTLLQFRQHLERQNHTLKRCLTDPRIFDGIGNAYSDEILHAACLSPLRRTNQLGDTEIESLYRAAVRVLQTWLKRLADERDGFPEKVTAFHPAMHAHGKFGQPCPVCGKTIQRIRYAQNECNYCPRCQTGDRILADRSLSRLLRDEWPKTLEELEES